MTKEEFFEKYKAVPEKGKDCKGCCFEDKDFDECVTVETDEGCIQYGGDCKYVRCKTFNCIYIEKPTKRRLNAFEEIANRFEEWSGDQSHNGDDMAEVAKDVINADNAYLLWQIEELQSLDAEEFKQEVLKVIKTFK